MRFSNVYEDARRAEAYAKLEFPGTYYLAYRDLPEIIFGRVKGRKALDFGCGTGRSTRFLRSLGFETTGVDEALPMILKARELDPGGDYRLIGEEGPDRAGLGSYDLVLSAFTFDNIPTAERKVALFSTIRPLLSPGGTMVNLVSAPEIYTHEWASFSTKDFPENSRARAGDRVKIIITELEDRRPVEDILWPDKEYREVYAKAGLRVAEARSPLARPEEPYQWVNETRIAPWVIYVLEAP
jgi:SAM-dependent methyltransferase